MGRTLVEIFEQIYFGDYDIDMNYEHIEDEEWRYSEDIEDSLKEYYNEVQIEEMIRQEIIDEEIRVAKMEEERREYSDSRYGSHVIEEL